MSSKQFDNDRCVVMLYLVQRNAKEFRRFFGDTATIYNDYLCGIFH